MKLALGKHAKLSLLVGVPIMTVAAIALFAIALNADRADEDYKVIRVGMTRSTIDAIMAMKGMLDEGNWSHPSSSVFRESDSSESPGRTIIVWYDWHDRATSVEVRQPEGWRKWNRWMRQLGL